VGSKFGLVRVSKQPYFYIRENQFIEIQAFSPSYDLALPLSKLSLLSSCVSPFFEITDGGEGDGEGAKSYDGETAWNSINYSILSDISISKAEFAYL
jgi:hypothetical protein